MGVKDQVPLARNVQKYRAVILGSHGGLVVSDSPFSGDILFFQPSRMAWGRAGRPLSAAAGSTQCGH